MFWGVLVFRGVPVFQGVPVFLLLEHAEPIRYQLNASEYFFASSHLQILKSPQGNMLFEKYWAFCDSEFSRLQVINYE